MNIKSLLLGSAAALVAVSGARAADAVSVAAEPEPAEYVRVCDTYGSGYFYVPGTETCLRIGGYVRFDVRGGDGPYGAISTTDKTDGSSSDVYSHNARLSLRTWTGTETELGTLSTFTETRFNYKAGKGNEDGLTLNFAWAQLGGFRVGKDESAFITFDDYAGAVIADDLVPYGPFDTNLVSYTFEAGNGISAILAFETGEAGTEYEIDSYVPHIVGGAKYSGGWGSVSAVAAYDSVYENWAGKVRADVDVNEQLSLFIMGGYGSDDVKGTAVAGVDADGEAYGYNNYKPWGGKWAIWGGGTYKLNEKAKINVQASYAEGYSKDGDLGVAANVDYELVKGFHIIPELTYTDYGAIDAKGPGDEGFGGMVRFQRNF
ncbi:MAG: porin [Rhizobiaceae bacterium]|nr:porin [Rhizobiaceae bacterium]